MTQLIDPGEPLLAAEQVDYHLGVEKILDQVNILVHAGEIVTLVGPNGAGKTTLLKILLGIIRCQVGKVWRKPGIRLGYVPQNMPMDWVLPLTVARFLKLGTGKISNETMEESLRLTGVAHLFDAPIQGLSGGEFKRVILARATLGRPDVLVLDEPVHGVDYTGQIELYRLIGHLRNQFGWGVLLVSHDLHIVMGATDKVVCLNRHVCCTGQPDQVSNHPEFIELFGNQFVKALALYHHRHHCDGETGHAPHGD